MALHSNTENPEQTMKTNIFDRSNRLIGWTLETTTQIQVFDRSGRMLGFYVKQTEKTHTTHGYFGSGNQLLRMLK
jgi:purine nucleoside permease